MRKQESKTKIINSNIFLILYKNKVSGFLRNKKKDQFIKNFLWG